MNENLGDEGTLVIWDADGLPAKSGGLLVLWRGFGDDTSPGSFSIPALIETQAEVLKARYLAWVYELGERRVQGRRLVDHMEARPGFSFWWMTLIVEKCNFSKSPHITDAVSLMALENWLAGRAIRKIVLVSSRRPLSECIRLWCTRSSIAFEWRRPSEAPEPEPWARRAHRYLPYPLQALIWLIRHSLKSWPLRGVGLSQWRESKGQVTFFSYLFNLAPGAVRANRFESHYWAHLPDLLQLEGCKTSWLHLHVKDALLPDEMAAAAAIRQFNDAGGDVQIHTTLGAFLTPRVILKSLFDAARLAWKCRRLGRALSVSNGTGFHLWPLFIEDWRRSTCGLTAMSNALYLNLFESALKSLPKQRIGVYLQENQGWEFALVHAWKAAGHGRLVGTPHATVRYWDLRYFFDPRAYRCVRKNALPMPDLVALNGPAELHAFQNGGYPVDAIVDVEALRYLHLAYAKPRPTFLPSPRRFLRVLVLGDYLLSNTLKQIRLLERAMLHLPEGTLITVKPHPACPLLSGDLLGIDIGISTSPVWELLSGCDVAYTSNATSAAADVYCAGVPVVSMLDWGALNQSPLRGRKGVFFVSTPLGLAQALLEAAATRCVANRQDFFTLDSKLPRWRKLLLDSIA